MLCGSSLSGNESYTMPARLFTYQTGQGALLHLEPKHDEHTKNAIEMLNKVIKLGNITLYTKGAVVFV